MPLIKTLRKFCLPVSGRILIVARKNGNQQIMVSENSHSGYSYAAGLEKLLADCATNICEVMFAIIAQMKKKLILEDLLMRANHIVVTYPKNHSDLHLEDVLIYNMGTLHRK